MDHVGIEVTVFTFLTGLMAGLLVIPALRMALNARAHASTADISTVNALKELVRKGTEEFKRLGLRNGKEA